MNVHVSGGLGGGVGTVATPHPFCRVTVGGMSVDLDLLIWLLSILIVVANIAISVYMVMGCGYLGSKLKLFPDAKKALETMNIYLFYFGIPAIIFNALYKVSITNVSIGYIPCFIAFKLVTLAWAFLSAGVQKLLEVMHILPHQKGYDYLLNVAVTFMSFTYPNTAMFGIPVTIMLYGPEVAFYFVITSLPDMFISIPVSQALLAIIKNRRTRKEALLLEMELPMEEDAPSGDESCPDETAPLSHHSGLDGLGLDEVLSDVEVAATATEVDMPIEVEVQGDELYVAKVTGGGIEAKSSVASMPDLAENASCEVNSSNQSMEVTTGEDEKNHDHGDEDAHAQEHAQEHEIGIGIGIEVETVSLAGDSAVTDEKVPETTKGAVVEEEDELPHSEREKPPNTNILVQLYHSKQVQAILPYLTFLRRMFLSPVIVSMVAGVLFNFSRLPAPSFFVAFLTMMSNTLIGCALFTLGIFLFTRSLLACKWWYAAYLLLLRQFVAPVIVIFLADLFQLEGVEYQIAVIMSAMPLATVPFNVFNQYQSGEGSISTVIVLGAVVFPLSLVFTLTCMYAYLGDTHILLLSSLHPMLL